MNDILINVDYKDIITSSCRCGATIGSISETGAHKKLTCFVCGSYIKMLSSNEYKLLYSLAVIDSSPVKDINPVIMDRTLLERIDRKLDMIMGHIGVPCN